jgi:hypothetical protein
MHRLQELVRLHRLGTGARAVARQLKMSPNIEREYRQALELAELLEGDPNHLPEVAELRQAIDAHKPTKSPPQHASSIKQWAEHVEALMKDGAAATAIYDRLRLEHEDFEGSLSAVKRLCARIRKRDGIRPEQVVMEHVIRGVLEQPICGISHEPRGDLGPDLAVA